VIVATICAVIILARAVVVTPAGLPIRRRGAYIAAVPITIAERPITVGKWIGQKIAIIM
jgi:hypothetical protein